MADLATIRKVGALVCVLGMVASWLLMGMLIKDENPKNYYFMAYFVHSSFVLFLLPWGIWVLCQPSPRRIFWAYRWQRNIRVAGIWGFLIIATGWSWYRSLPLTPLAANTAIYNSCAAFVLVFSVPLLGSRLEWRGALCVATAVVGIFLTSFFTPKTATPTTATATGYALLLLSTALYAFGEVLYKRWDRLEDQMVLVGCSECRVDGYEEGPLLRQSEVDVAGKEGCGACADKGVEGVGVAMKDSATLRVMNAWLFTGLIGVTVFLFAWPPLLLMGATDWEPVFPASQSQWASLGYLSLFVATYDALLLASISLSDPLWVSVGTMLSIPASAIADWLAHGVLPTWVQMIGAALIAGSFLGITWVEAMEEREKVKEEGHQN